MKREPALESPDWPWNRPAPCPLPTACSRLMGSCGCISSCVLSEPALPATAATTGQDAAQEITVPGLALGAGSHSAWQRPRLVLCDSLTGSMPGPSVDRVIECGKTLRVSQAGRPALV